MVVQRITTYSFEKNEEFFKKKKKKKKIFLFENPVFLKLRLDLILYERGT